VIGQVRNALNLDCIEVLEVNPDGKSWRRLAGIGWVEPPDLTIEVATTPRVQYLISPNAPRTAIDLHSDLFPDDESLRSNGLTDGLITPIPGQNQSIGLLGVYTRSHRQFPPGEYLFLQALADVLGVAAERKRLESELRLRVRDLAEGDRRKDEFLAMLAHELRNPLSPVRNGLQVLQVKYGNEPEVNRLAEMMNRQVGQLARLVDDLLDVSRITRGKVNLRREKVDLRTIVNQAVEASRPLIDSRRHELSVESLADPILLNADPSRLTQVVGNLLNNAAKYTDEGGQIGLHVFREGDQAVVRVRDTGVGISSEMLPQVFDLFTQIDRTVDRSQGGLGVGLTLVRSLVELHAGTVHVSSPGAGRGSEFVIRLPVLPSTTSVDSEIRVVPQSPRVPSKSQRILIVDDNADAADSLAMILRLSGHQVWTAYRGSTALEVAETQRPDVILLDIGLPGMDGYEVARRLRRNPDMSGIALVALTGYGHEDDRRKTRDVGFDQHLVKPVDPVELMGLLSQIKM